MRLSADAVDSEIVGRDRDTELIGTLVTGAVLDLLLLLLLLAVTSEVCAVIGSVLDLGEVENN